VLPAKFVRVPLVCESSVAFDSCRLYSTLQPLRRRPLGNNTLDVWAPHGSAYTLTYSASDAMGNIKTSTRVVSLVDTRPPVINLPATLVYLEYSSRPVAFALPPDRFGPTCAGVVNNTVKSDTLQGLACVTAFDSLDGNVSCSVIFGVFPATALHNFSASNIPGANYSGFYQNTSSGCFQRNVSAPNTTVDGAPPILSVERDCPTSGPFLLSTLNASKPFGTAWFVKYLARDARPNDAVVVRKVVVFDTAPPTISVLYIPDVPYSGVLADSERLTGIEATDEYDGNVTSLLTAGSDPVNSVVAGLQNVTVRAVDQRGNWVILNRLVNVLPEIVNLPDKNVLINVTGFDLPGVDPAQFNKPEKQQLFRLAVLLAIANQVRSVDLSYIALEDMHSVYAAPKDLSTPVVGGSSSGSNNNKRRDTASGTNDIAATSSEVSFLVFIKCGDYASARTELERLLSQGLVSLELYHTNDALFANVFSAASTSTSSGLLVEVSQAKCPQAVITKKASAGVPVIVYVIVPLVVVILIVILAVWWSRRQFAKRREKISLMQLASMNGDTMQVGDFNLPLDRRRYDEDFLGNASSSDDEDAQECIKLVGGVSWFCLVEGVSEKNCRVSRRACARIWLRRTSKRPTPCSAGVLGLFAYLFLFLLV
jgi:hypothetical protein